MKKTTTLKILAVTVAFFFSSGIKCVRERKVVSNAPVKVSPSDANAPIGTGAPTKIPTAAPIKVYSPDEKAAVDLAESFIVPYTTYKTGDYSNWELLFGKMTQAFQIEITNWIASEKKKSKGQIAKYINYSGIPQKTDLIKISGGKAEVKIEVDQEEVRGAIVSRTNLTGPTSVWVDENGKEISYENIQRKIYTKTFYLFLAKEGFDWKVDSITVGN